MLFETNYILFIRVELITIPLSCKNLKTHLITMIKVFWMNSLEFEIFDCTVHMEYAGNASVAKASIFLPVHETYLSSADSYGLGSQTLDD